MPLEIGDDEFAIVIKPLQYTEDGSDWAGDVSTGIGISNTSTIPPVVAAHLVDIATLMSAFLDVVNEYPDIYEIVADRRDELMGFLEDEDERTRPAVSKDGNVYTLDIWTKTKGNA
jgi:hypothetical protein